MKSCTIALLVGMSCWCICSGPAVLGQAQPPKKIIKVASPVKGIVAKVLVKEGDAVKAGQVLVQIDDKMALIEMKIAQGRVAIAKEEHNLAVASKNEAEAQLIRTEKLGPKVISKEELDIKKFWLEKAIFEERMRLESVKVAKYELEKAEILLLMYRVVSPAEGKVIKIHKDAGEGVKELGTVVEIAVDGK